MARHWRLRHKLLLGLGLIVISLGLLLAGTMQGLTSYVGMMDTTTSKLAELTHAQRLKIELVNLIQAGAPLINANFDSPQPFHQSTLDDHFKTTREAYNECRRIIEEDRAKGFDPSPYQEKVLLADLEESIKKYSDALQSIQGLHVVDPSGNDPKLQPIVAMQHRMLRLADELLVEIVGSVFHKIDRAKWNYRLSVAIVIGASIAAVVIMLTLVYLFSGWVFAPIRTLQAGVKRVTNGDFDHPIGLKSGDELQQLADGFDTMTQKLRDIYDDLERQVNDRSRQLVRSERMVSVGFLAAGVSHEINNPLASISFCSEALEIRLRDVIATMPPAEAETATKYLRMIQQEAFRCKGITQKLLEFSRVGERRRESTDLSELIQSVLEIAQHLQNCRGKHIVFQPITRVVAQVNGQDIKSVVLNLVVNALDSMGEGGVLTITLQTRGPTAEMLFTDSGCGMSPDVLENIFEPFFTRSRTGKGTGLGLFISHQIIDQHGGTIEATSPGPGNGSTFAVSVPLIAVVEQRPPLALRTEEDTAVRANRSRRPSQQTEDGLGNVAA